MPPTTRGSIAPMLALAVALGGCASWLPGADRIDVQQGNVLTDGDIAGLAPGQSRARVRELIGAPVLASPFHADRWDYVYYRTDAGGTPDPQRLTLIFEGDTLRRVLDRYEPPQDPLPESYGGTPPEPEQPAGGGGGRPGPGRPGPGSPGPGMPGPG